MPQVKLPSGEIVEFPYSMSDEEIVAAIQQMDAPATEKPSLMENIWGKGEIDTPGERLGQTIRDMGASLLSGAGRGAVGLGTMAGYVGSGAAGGGGRGLGEALEQTRGISEDVVPGLGYAPKTTAGEYAGTVGEFIPGAMLGGGLGAIPKFAAIPGIASEFAGQMTEGKPIEPYARLGAAVVSPMAATGLQNIARRAVTPYPADPARTAFAERLTAEGVPTTAGQRTGAEGLMYREAATGKGAQIAGEQGEAFTAAALRSAGSTAKRATPEVMDDLSTTLGKQFETLAARNNITVDQRMLDDVVAAVDDYAQLTSKTNVAPMLRSMLSKFTDKLGTGQPITGREYQSFRSALGKAMVGSDRNLGGSAATIRNAMDDALERTLQTAGNTAEIANYTNLREQYRNFLAIEKSVGGASVEAAYGIINPANLRTAVAQQGRRAYTQGGRELGELARAGKAVMAPLPQSGTAPRLMAAGAPTAGSIGGGGIGGGLGFALGGPIGGGIGAAAGTALGGMTPRALNALRMTDIGQKYLANQALAGPGRALMDQRLLGTIASGMANR